MFPLGSGFRCAAVDISSAQAGDAENSGNDFGRMSETGVRFNWTNSAGDISDFKCKLIDPSAVHDNAWVTTIYRIGSLVFFFCSANKGTGNCAHRSVWVWRLEMGEKRGTFYSKRNANIAVTDLILFATKLYSKNGFYTNWNEWILKCYRNGLIVFDCILIIKFIL